VFPGEDGASRILDEALAGPFRGVKIHCHVMKIAPDDPRLDPVFAASARYRKPVVIHCGPEPSIEGYGVNTRDVSGAARLRRALQRHPDAIVVVPHLGVDETAQFEAMFAEFAGLYMDTTMMLAGYFPYQPDPDLIRRHPDRILYGSDFPNLPYAWDRELQNIRALKLPADLETRLLGTNAKRLFD
jgi:predicted TIM-barrel fold metal-dependent hydrolase